MRYRKILVVGLSTFIGVICTSVEQTAAQDADPFGSGEQPTAKQISSAAITDKQASPRLSPAERIRKALSEPCTLDYDEAAWSDVEADLEARYQINIVLSQSARDDSLTDDDSITVNLRGIRLGNALRLMLMENNATFVAQDQVLRIISLDDAASAPHFFSRRIFDVSEILLAADGWHQKEKTSADNAYDDGGGGGREAGSSVRRASETSLTELVLQSVQPDAWRHGSEVGLATCNPFCGRLIVNGPEQLLDDVEDFLREIEASLSTQ